MLVVAAILFIFGAIALQSFSGSTAKARDTQRVSDLEQIRIAVRLYGEQNDSYPANFYLLGVGSSIDETLESFIPTIPRDPRHGDDDDFRYVYNDTEVCNGNSYVVVYARTMETDGFSNVDDLGCDGLASSYPNARVLIVGETPS